VYAGESCSVAPNEYEGTAWVGIVSALVPALGYAKSSDTAGKVGSDNTRLLRSLPG
jgi:hypothetical protein